MALFLFLLVLPHLVWSEPVGDADVDDDRGPPSYEDILKGMNVQPLTEYKGWNKKDFNKDTGEFSWIIDWELLYKGKTLAEQVFPKTDCRGSVKPLPDTFGALRCASLAAATKGCSNLIMVGDGNWKFDKKGKKLTSCHCFELYNLQKIERAARERSCLFGDMKEDPNFNIYRFQSKFVVKRLYENKKCFDENESAGWFKGKQKTNFVTGVHYTTAGDPISCLLNSQIHNGQCQNIVQLTRSKPPKGYESSGNKCQCVNEKRGDKEVKCDKPKEKGLWGHKWDVYQYSQVFGTMVLHDPRKTGAVLIHKGKRCKAGSVPMSYNYWVLEAEDCAAKAREIGARFFYYRDLYTSEIKCTGVNECVIYLNNRCSEEDMEDSPGGENIKDIGSIYAVHIRYFRYYVDNLAKLQSMEESVAEEQAVSTSLISSLPDFQPWFLIPPAFVVVVGFVLSFQKMAIGNRYSELVDEL